jgi:hypothetical protein
MNEDGIWKKDNEWIGRNVDLSILSQKVFQFFRDDGFDDILVADAPDGTWHAIQAKKSGVLRTIGSSRKSVFVGIKGNPNHFQVAVGAGEWDLNANVAIAFTEAVGLVGLGFGALFQKKLWQYIKESIDSLTNSYSITSNKTQSENPPAGSARNEKYCIVCGKGLPKEAKFCSQCGNPQL